MTFKCGAASFDCSHGAAGRDVFLRFSFSCFSLYRFFIFSRVLSLSLSLFFFTPFEFPRNNCDRELTVRRGVVNKFGSLIAIFLLPKASAD